MNYDTAIYTLVNHGIGERIAELTRGKGARGGTILVGKGTSDSALMRFLAIGDIEREMLITLVTDDQKTPLIGAIRARCAEARYAGCLFTISTGGKRMDCQSKFECITVIVNRGYADDVMEAARKAGATGGTILHARGTGKPDDEKFFGITIVPEKEQVIILAERETAEGIKSAIRGLECLSVPGMGIMYSCPVEDFLPLGKN